MTPQEILRVSGISLEPFAGWPNVYISSANQLLGPYRSIKRAQLRHRAYLGWEAHHIVEFTDLERLNVAGRFPSRDEQLCVLVPSEGHRQRINQILRSANPPGMKVNVDDLLRAYKSAYSILGNYSGGGEAAVCDELLRIARATFTAGSN